MTKHQAQDSLDVIIAQKTGGTTQPRADEHIATLGWFTRNRFFPLREGSTWKEETASTRKSAIEQDILAKFGDVAHGADRQVHAPDAPERPCPDTCPRDGSCTRGST